MPLFNGGFRTGDRQARRVASALIERDVLTSETSRASAACFPGGAGIALDAWPVSGSAWLRDRLGGHRIYHRVLMQHSLKVSTEIGLRL